MLCHTYIDGLGGMGKLVCQWMALAGKPPVAPNGFPTSPLTRQLRRDGALAPPSEPKKAFLGVFPSDSRVAQGPSAADSSAWQAEKANPHPLVARHSAWN